VSVKKEVTERSMKYIIYFLISGFVNVFILIDRRSPDKRSFFHEPAGIMKVTSPNTWIVMLFQFRNGRSPAMRSHVNWYDKCASGRLMTAPVIFCQKHKTFFWVYPFNRSGLQSMLNWSGLFCLLIIAFSGGRWYALKNNRSVVSGYEEQLVSYQKTLDERDWLMKEVHHRVKNNLQLVISLLNSQLNFLTNEEAVKAIRNSQNRMFAMSLIHHKLYQSGSAASIDIIVYIRELTEYLLDDYKLSSQIIVNTNLDPLTLDINQALPLGLIINEVITNAVKYAFPNKSGGELTFYSAPGPDSEYTLIMADNGIGIQEDLRESENSLGRVLMTGLAGQLGAHLEIKTDEGVKVILKFSKTHLPETNS
jgi:two-component sensor histidine kinase